MAQPGSTVRDLGSRGNLLSEFSVLWQKDPIAFQSLEFMGPGDNRHPVGHCIRENLWAVVFPPLTWEFEATLPGHFP